MTKNCLLRSLSWEPYIIWLSFMVHMFKVIISPGVFFFFNYFFKILLVFVVRLVKGQKTIQNYKKFCLSHSIPPGNIHHMIAIYSTHVQNANTSGYFFQSFKALFSQIVRVTVKGLKMVQNDKNICCALYLRNNTLYDFP